MRGGSALLREVDLHVEDGQRLVLLGASGSGKTTVLRVIAGVQPVAKGTVCLDDQDVTSTPPQQRGLALVNQEGSLHPHLDVRGNLRFPLEVRGVKRHEVDARVDAEARAFSLTGLLRRRPSTLAEGERHEVALARSVVRTDQRALLIDEPFARVDATRRGALLRELITLQRGYAVTMVVATNDQRVAMGLAQRIAVLDEGRVLQVADPATMYDQPDNVVVAGTVGEPTMNLLPGRLDRSRGRVEVVADDLRIATWQPPVTRSTTETIWVGIRPTSLALTDQGGAGVLHGTVRRRAFLGHAVELWVDDGLQLVHAVVDPPGAEVGDAVRLAVKPAAVHVFDRLTGRAIAHGV